MLDAVQIVKTLDCWTAPITVQKLGGGISNDNFQVEHDGKHYVVRVNTDVPEHGVLRINDANCNRAAAAAGVAPEVFFATENALIIQYIDGKTLSEEDIRHDETLRDLLVLIKKTHVEAARLVRGPVCAFWPFRICRDYAFFLEENNSQFAPLLWRLRQLNDQLETYIGSVSLVLGHNDLLAANVIDDGARLWLIDWEHAGLTSPLFDLANLSTNNGLTTTQENWMLEYYFEQPLKEHLAHQFAAMKCASLLREAMWGMVSQINSRLDFDYVAYAQEHLDRFEQHISQLDQ
jgi:thiamine kinase-like enzyme